MTRAQVIATLMAIAAFGNGTAFADSLADRRNDAMQTPVSVQNIDNELSANSAHQNKLVLFGGNR